MRILLLQAEEKNNPEAVKVLVSEGPDDVRKIMTMGVDFDKDENGNPMKTLEGGHCRRRIVHHKDQTGHEIVIKLLEQVKKRKNITLRENIMITSAQRVAGGFRVDMIVDGEKHEAAYSSYLLLATGRYR